MRSTRHARLGLQLADQVEDLGLRRHVERRRRLVGDEEGRARDQRHGDHGALAQAAGQLERIGRRARASGSGKPTRAKTSTARSRASALRSTSAWSRSASRDLVADRVQRRQRGHRLLEDHGDAAAAQGAHRLAVGVERGDVDRRLGVGRIVEQDRAARRCAPTFGRMRRIACAVTDLPEPDSPTSATVLPCGMSKRQAVDGAESAGVGLEIDRQIADRQERRRPCISSEALGVCRIAR